MTCEKVSNYAANRALYRARSVGQTEAALNCPTCGEKVTVTAGGEIKHAKSGREHGKK